METEPDVQVCRVTTRDGIHLEGSLARASDARCSWSVDLIVLVHGTGSNFYAGGVLEAIAHRAVPDGLSVLRVNTRAHDLIANLSTQHGRRLGGAAFEEVDDCRADITAWLDWAQDRGFASIGLGGVSMGAVKSIYSQASDPHPAVKRIVALAPPRFHHETWISDPRSDAYREHLMQAQELVSAGKGDTLMSLRQPLPIYLTAEGFLHKYGPEDRYDFVPLLERLRVPTRVVIGSGSMQSSPAFTSTPGAIAALTNCPPHVECVVLDGPDTPFHGYFEVAYEQVRDWIAENANPGDLAGERG